MKAIGYQPSVSLGVGNTPASQVGGSAISYGGDGSGYAAVSKGLENVQAAIEKQREEDMVADITAAKNEYDKRVSDLLYDEEKGLMRRELDNARGVGKDYEAEEKKIRQEVMKMLPKYEKAHLAFGNMVDKTNAQNFNLVREHSYKQKEAYKAVNFDNAVKLRAENAERNYANANLVAEQLADAKTLLYANYKDKGEEWCAAKNKEIEADIIGKTLTTAISSGDLKSAENLLNVFEGKIAPDKLNSYRKGIVEANKQDFLLTKAQQLASSIGYDLTKVDDAVAGVGSYEIGGKSVPMTAVDKEALRKRLTNEITRHEKVEKERLSNIIEAVDDEMYNLFTSGNKNPEDYIAIANRHIGDKDAYKAAMKCAKSYAEAFGTKGNKLSNDDVAQIKDAIDMGRITDKDILRDELASQGVSPEQTRSIIKYFDTTKENGYNWGGLKKDFEAQYNIKGNNGIWLGAKEAATEFVDKYIKEHNGQKPTYYQVREALLEAAQEPKVHFWTNTKGWAGFEKLGLSRAAMHANGWSNVIENKENDTVTIYHRNGVETVMDKDEFDELADAMRLKG